MINTTFAKFYETHKRYFTYKKVSKSKEKYTLKAGYLLTVDQEPIDTIEKQTYKAGDTVTVFSGKNEIIGDVNWFTSYNETEFCTVDERFKFRLYSVTELK